jgi:hypothetical protein
MLSVPMRGVKLVHEGLGKSGRWVAISPGGRRGPASGRGLGVLLADAAKALLLLGHVTDGRHAARRPVSTCHGACFIDFLRRRGRMA